MTDSKEIFFQTEKDNRLCVWYFPEEEMLRVYFNNHLVDWAYLREQQPR